MMGQIRQTGSELEGRGLRGTRAYGSCPSRKAANDSPVSLHKSLAREKLMMAHAEKR